jgi:uncharacterized OB-fold protein
VIPDGLIETNEDGSIDLVGGYSPSSGKYHFPMLTTCPYSGAEDVERVILSRDGTVWAWTAVTAAPPGYEGEVPYGFGVVELTKEKLRIVTRLGESDPSQLSFGQAVTLGPEELPGGMVTWTFR